MPVYGLDKSKVKKRGPAQCAVEGCYCLHEQRTKAGNRPSRTPVKAPWNPPVSRAKRPRSAPGDATAPVAIARAPYRSGIGGPWSLKAIARSEREVSSFIRKRDKQVKRNIGKGE